MAGNCSFLFIINKPNMLATKHNSCVYLSQSLSLSLHLYIVSRKVCYAPVNFDKAT